MPRPRHSQPKPGRGSRSLEEETTRLPYLINAALRLKGLQDAEPGDWTALRPRSEERQESDQSIKIKKKSVKRVKKHVPGRKKALPNGDVSSLPALDERVLILCRSSMKRAWKQQQQLEKVDASLLLVTHYGHEANYAATQIQKIVRGGAARTEWRAFYCLKNQHAATQIQFAFRRVLVYRKVLARLAKKRNDRATQIQAWVRGHRCRDVLLYQNIRIMNQRIANFQRYIRGRRLWRIVMATLHKRRSEVATEIQRCYRGWKGRQCAVAVRFELNRHVRQLVHETEIHSQCARCKGCNLETCTEESLFRCFMVRYVGLHDFKGAKILGEDGLRLFPTSSKFVFFFSVLLQAMSDEMEISMAYLKRAKEMGIAKDVFSQCETHFFQPAHLLRPNDAQAFLDSAIFCQCCDQLSRAEANYSKALLQSPLEYEIPGYLHRVIMLDRLLLNYHRFCSIFNFRQVNVLLKEVFTAKKGKKTRLMVSKLNHYTVVMPMDDPSACRINALYLTDDEVISIIKQSDGDAKEGSMVDTTTHKSRKNIVNWGNSDSNSSMRLKDVRPVARGKPVNSSRALLKNITITQLDQQEFAGLNVKPSDLAQFSETRSKLRLTKPAAEILLSAITFVDPAVGLTEAPIVLEDKQQQPAIVLHKIMMIPSILKIRQRRRGDSVLSRAAIDAQRVYRGFRLRAEVRRDRLLNDIKQHQVDGMYRRLHENYLFRELRRSSAIAIQRIYKGYAFRKLVRCWQLQAGLIQRVFRGYRGRVRAAAFRDGSCTFYMAQRVFQRGVDIDGRQVMLIIDKCGLSFRLDGYDFDACVTYHGFVSHASTIALLCYLNWTYGETLCGRELSRRGNKVMICSVSAINCTTAECFVDCVVDKSVNSITIPLAECIHSINLRNFSAGDEDTPVLLLPITVDDTSRVVEAIAERVILTPALRMPTQDLKAKASADFTISVQPPPTMHFTYQQKSNLGGKRLHSNSLPSTALQFVYPVINGLRGVSIGTTHFRKKCTRHAVQFTRCCCILPIVSTSAHIEAISRALAPP